MAKFRKGVSGNPAGRKSGETPGAKLRQAILADMPCIIATLVEQAKSGDTASAKILVDKVIPGIKPQSLSVNVPTGADLAQTGENIISSTLSGQIAPDISVMLMNMLNNQVRVEGLTSISERLAVLEGNSG